MAANRVAAVNNAAVNMVVAANRVAVNRAAAANRAAAKRAVVNQADDKTTSRELRRAAGVNSRSSVIFGI